MRACSVFLCLIVLLCGFPSLGQRQTGSSPALAKRSISRPNIILITLDTTRADRMGFLGSAKGLTPHLDRLARGGAVFTKAYSQVPLTTASHASILTGTYPQYNHVNDFGVPLATGLPYLPELLHQSGYRTGAFVGSLILDPSGGTAPGFDRGFDIYDAGFHIKRPGDDRYQSIERRAGDVVAHAITWLRQQEGGAPFFLWVHLYDPHDPYDPPEPYKSKWASQPYEGEIAYADAMVGKLFDLLRERGLYDKSAIAVMADHGEAFGEHGERTHGIFLYDETIHVPLVIKLPGGTAASGMRIDSQVALVDVMPTLLSVAGVPVPKEVQGQSLLIPISGSAKKDTAPADRPIYSETDYPFRAFKWSSLRALRTGKYLAIEAPQPELYDRSSDPFALRNIAGSARAVADTLVSQLQDFRRKTASDVASAAKLDPEQAQKLAALGYASGEGGILREGRVEGTDPKQRIEVANLMHDGMMDVEQGRYPEAVANLQRVLEAEPNVPVAYIQLGTAYTRLKDYEKALPVLRKAVELKADNAMAQYELGLALFETGNWKEAAPQFEAAVEKAPKWADAQFSLASVYARIDRVPEAMSHLDICLALSPDHYRANLLRGRILSLQKRPQEALANLEKAAAVQPDSREAHLFLADAYAQLGREADAQRERGRAGQHQ